MNGAAAVRRVELPSLTPGPQFALGYNRFYNAWYLAEDLQVQPGHPDVVAVARNLSLTLAPQYGQHAGVVIFDHGVQRPNGTEINPTGSTTIQFSASGDRLYGMNNYTGGQLYQMAVDASGVSVARKLLVAGGYDREEIRLDGGLIYTASGWIIDPETGRMMGRFPSLESGQPVFGPFVPDSTVQRVFYLTSGLNGVDCVLRAYDSRTLRAAGSLPIPGVMAPARRLIRCGADRLAFRTEADQLFLVYTRLVPSPSLTLAIAPAAVQGGGTVTARVELRDPAPAGGARVLLSSDSPAVRPPAEIVVPAGATSAGAAVATAPGFNTAPATITAGSGGQSAFATLQVLARPAPAVALGPGSTLRQVSLPTRDLRYDPSRRVLLATVPGRAGNIGNSLVSIDPATGAVLAVTDAGSEPRRMALSADGRFMYVGLDGAAAVRRFDRETGTADLQFWLNPIDGDPWLRIAGAMAPVPGDPSRVAVSRVRGGYEDDGGPVTIYESGAPLPGATQEPLGLVELEAGDAPPYLFGHDYHDLIRLTVGPSGVVATDRVSYLAPRLHGVRYVGGRVYLGSGQVLDPKSLQVIGVYPDLPPGSAQIGLTAPDLATGRVFFMPAVSTALALYAYDLQTFRRIGSLEIPGVDGGADRLVRWGSDGIAFRTDQDRIYLIQSPLISGVATADLAVAMTASATVREGDSFTARITVTNNGPDAATEVVLTDPLPSGLAFFSASASQGTASVSRRIVTCRLGDLPVGAAAVVTLTLSPQRGGAISNTVSVQGKEVDPAPDNNSAAQSITVTQ
jgi:uncharacterized repeat protein (TIGR01451 family)